LDKEKDNRVALESEIEALKAATASGEANLKRLEAELEQQQTDASHLAHERKALEVEIETLVRTRLSLRPRPW
jgi:predicted  nucleic acid-binding Zn-ribbon protein